MMERAIDLCEEHGFLLRIAAFFLANVGEILKDIVTRTSFGVKPPLVPVAMVKGIVALLIVAHQTQQLQVIHARRSAPRECLEDVFVTVILGRQRSATKSIATNGKPWRYRHLHLEFLQVLFTQLIATTTTIREIQRVEDLLLWHRHIVECEEMHHNRFVHPQVEKADTIELSCCRYACGGWLSTTTTVTCWRGSTDLLLLLLFFVAIMCFAIVVFACFSFDGLFFVQTTLSHQTHHTLLFRRHVCYCDRLLLLCLLCLRLCSLCVSSCTFLRLFRIQKKRHWLKLDVIVIFVFILIWVVVSCVVTCCIRFAIRMRRRRRRRRRR
mmetsp:Transcript_55552/g.92367  ORF Transcript_55552/g.92367 Transcript_55552/m.92367 type:complete len:325 (+) Transcript_55552:586-1560(+)